MKNKMGKSTLVKIDRTLYNVVKAKVEKNKVEFPSIKHFIDQAVTKALGFREYNIEGIDDRYLEERPLRKLVGEPNKNFFMCQACNRPFLKEKNDSSDAAKICPNCRATIAHFAPKLKKDKK